MSATSAMAMQDAGRRADRAAGPGRVSALRKVQFIESRRPTSNAAVGSLEAPCRRGTEAPTSGASTAESSFAPRFSFPKERTCGCRTTPRSAPSATRRRARTGHSGRTTRSSTDRERVSWPDGLPGPYFRPAGRECRQGPGPTIGIALPFPGGAGSIRDTAAGAPSVAACSWSPAAGGGTGRSDNPAPGGTGSRSTRPIRARRRTSTRPSC